VFLDLVFLDLVFLDLVFLDLARSLAAEIKDGIRRSLGALRAARGKWSACVQQSL
jgi:hypothetical protein